MKLLNWLFGRAATVNSEAPPVLERLQIEGGFASTIIDLEDDYDDEMDELLDEEPLPLTRSEILDAYEAERAAEKRKANVQKKKRKLTLITDLEQLYTIIDYKDAGGKRTRRRITMQRLVKGPEGPIVEAICHERQRFRMFRCDRIECFIGHDDGEITATDQFFREVLLLDLAELTPTKPKRQKTLGPTATQTTAITGARAMREKLRAPLSILVLAATADNDFHEEELEVICQWLEDEVQDFIDTGEIGLAEIDAMTTLIRKMHPTRRSLPTHLRNIRRMDEVRFQRLARALRRVILADGVLRVEEAEFYADLADLRSAEFEQSLEFVAIESRA